MRTRTTAALAALAAAATLAAAGCGDIAAIGDELEDQHRFSFTGEQLEIENRDVDLRIVAGTGDEVEVERSLTGKAARDGNHTLDFADGTLTLGITCSGVVVDCGGLHIVHVPPGVAVEVSSRGGAVRSAGFPGDLTATVDDNWLRVEDPAGALRLTASLNVDVTGAESAEVTAKSTERGVDLQFSTAPTTIKATAREGAVRITVPDGDETYRVNASSTGGEVRTSVPRDRDSERAIEALAEQGNVVIRVSDGNA